MILYYLPLAPFLYLWYSITVYSLPAYTYVTLLSSTCSLPISMVLYNLLLPQGLFLSYFTTFNWLTAYPYGTLLSSTAYPYGTYHLLLYTVYTNVTLLSSTGSLLIPILFYYLLLDLCLYLWYSTTFYWLPD